jgi:hypothetical protein
MPPITLDPSMISRNLHGKTVIVTGGSNGIGAETIKLFYTHGANVVIADLPSSEPSATSLLSSLDDSSSSRTLYVPANIVNWEEMKAVYSRTIERFGSVEIVVANAGIMETKPFFDMEDLDKEPLEAYKVVDVNVKGTMNSQSAFYSKFKALFVLLHILNMGHCQHYDWPSIICAPTLPVCRTRREDLSSSFPLPLATLAAQVSCRTSPPNTLSLASCDHRNRLRSRRMCESMRSLPFSHPLISQPDSRRSGRKKPWPRTRSLMSLWQFFRRHWTQNSREDAAW